MTRTLFLLLACLAVGCPTSGGDDDDSSVTDDDDATGDDDDATGDDDDATGDDDDATGDDDDATGDDDDATGDDDDATDPPTVCDMAIPSDVTSFSDVTVNPGQLASVPGVPYGLSWSAWEVPLTNDPSTEDIFAVRVTFDPPMLLPDQSEATDVRFVVDKVEETYDPNAPDYFGVATGVQGDTTVDEVSPGYAFIMGGWIAQAGLSQPATGTDGYVECILMGVDFQGSSSDSDAGLTVSIQARDASWSP